MDTERLWGFAALATALIIIPGPSVVFIVGRAISRGRREALLTVLTNALGQYLQIAAVAFGIGALVEASVLACTLLKLVGATYLVLLGIRTWVRRGQPQIGSPGSVRQHLSVGGDAWAGLLVGATNPKTAVFFAAVLPSFVDRLEGHVPLQILILGLVWMVLVLIGDSAWALAAARAGAWFSRSPRRASTATGASGLVTACLGVALAFTGKSS